MMEVDIHSIENGYKENITLGDNEELAFYVIEGNDLTRFYSSSYCPDRGPGSYSQSITAREIEAIDGQTDTGVPLNYQMKSHFTFHSKFVSDEIHKDWTDYILMQGEYGSEYSVMSVIGFRPGVEKEFMDRIETASGEEMAQIWQEIIESDGAYVKTVDFTVKYWDGAHPDAEIYVGIIEKE